MIPAKRQERIIEILKISGSAAIPELAERLECSPMTVRRDIELLVSKNLVTSTYGGVSINRDLKTERRYDARAERDIEAKKKIATAAVGLVKSGDTLMLDAGTTTFYLAELICDIEGITVITPDLRIALELSCSNVKTYIPGGKIQNETGCVISDPASEFIRSISVDIAFIGMSGISRQFMMHTPTLEKAKFKRYFLENSEKAVLLADGNKFGRQSFFKVGPLSALNHLVTDKKFSTEELETLHSLSENHDFLIDANLTTGGF